MEVRITQNQIGNFNLLSSEKSLSFSMGLFDDSKSIEVDGIKAVLHFSGKPEEQPFFDDAYGMLGEVFAKCFEYSQCIWSSTNYKAQCLLFAKIYQENYDEINSALLEKHKIDTKKKIEKLQRELQYNEIAPHISYEVNTAIRLRISSLKKSIEHNQKELISLRKKSIKYIKTKDLIGNYQTQIVELKASLLEEQ